MQTICIPSAKMLHRTALCCIFVCKRRIPRKARAIRSKSSGVGSWPNANSPKPHVPSCPAGSTWRDKPATRSAALQNATVVSRACFAAISRIVPSTAPRQARPVGCFTSGDIRAHDAHSGYPEIVNQFTALSDMPSPAYMQATDRATAVSTQGLLPEASLIRSVIPMGAPKRHQTLVDPQFQLSSPRGSNCRSSDTAP